MENRRTFIKQIVSTTAAISLAGCVTKSSAAEPESTPAAESSDTADSVENEQTEPIKAVMTHLEASRELLGGVFSDIETGESLADYPLPSDEVADHLEKTRTATKMARESLSTNTDANYNAIEDVVQYHEEVLDYFEKAKTVVEAVDTVRNSTILHEDAHGLIDDTKTSNYLTIKEAKSVVDGAIKSDAPEEAVKAYDVAEEVQQAMDVSKAPNPVPFETEEFSEVAPLSDTDFRYLEVRLEVDQIHLEGVQSFEVGHENYEAEKYARAVEAFETSAERANAVVAAHDNIGTGDVPHWADLTATRLDIAGTYADSATAYEKAAALASDGSTTKAASLQEKAIDELSEPAVVPYVPVI